jgi:hypothetical protein
LEQKSNFLNGIIKEIFLSKVGEKLLVW